MESLGELWLDIDIHAPNNGTFSTLSWLVSTFLTNASRGQNSNGLMLL
jgi:hypothetical protein